MNTESNTPKIALNIGIMVVVLFALYFFYMHVASQPAPTTSPEATSTVATTSVSTTATQSTAAPKAAPKALQAPDISVTPQFSTTVASDARAAINTKLAADRDAIQEFPTDMSAWIDVANQYKTAGDYAMTIKVLNYVSAKWPSNIVSYNNLGDLYANYVKDYPKAEAAYLQHIKNFATDLNAYRALFTIYTTTSYKPSNTAAEDILKKAIAANPSAYDIEVLLAQYYAKLGRTSDAKVQYDAAIAAAKAQGKTDLAAQMQQEEAALK